MSSVVLKCIFMPLAGTTLGSALVFFMGGRINKRLHSSLLGVASGVMVAASVWSLIIPAIERCAHLGRLSFLPVLAGFWVGILVMMALDKILPEPNANSLSSGNRSRSMLFFAVTLHNLPEGMAVGTVLAALCAGESGVTTAGAVTLALGIALQNIPEGSIISMPLSAGGMSKPASFMRGFFSGVVEPVGALATLIFASYITSVLPFMLAFAAGAMVFVALHELIPEMLSFGGSTMGAIMFALGFSIMMCLDVALG